MSEGKLDYIAHKLDDVSDKVNEIDKALGVHISKFDEAVKDNEDDRKNIKRNTDVLSENTNNLVEHMKRTDLLESYIRKIDERFTPLELEAMRKKAVSEWTKDKLMLIAKIGGALSALGAIGAALRLLFQYLS